MSDQMKYDHLIKSIEDSAEERIQEIKEGARIESEKIRSEARDLSEERHQALLKEARARIAVEENTKIYRARENVKEKIARYRQDSFNGVFESAAHALSSMRKDPDYEPFFLARLKEVIHEMDSPATVLHIDPRDEGLCRRLMDSSGMKFEIVTDITTNGGLTASDPAGNMFVYNTIETRLDRVKETMRTDIIRILFGDRDVR